LKKRQRRGRRKRNYQDTKQAIELFKGERIYESPESHESAERRKEWLDKG